MEKVTIKAIKDSYNEFTGTWKYDNFGTDLSSVQDIVDEFLVNNFSADFDTADYQIWFGENIDEGNIYLIDDNFDNILSVDNDDLVVYTYEYDRDENTGDITIFIDAGEDYDYAKTICKIIKDKNEKK